MKRSNLFAGSWVAILVHFEEPQFKAVLCLRDHYIPPHLMDSVIKATSRKVMAGAKHD